VADLTNDRRLHELLRPSYDIVIMMAVWHQIRTASGEAVADRVVATLARRCSGTFITKNNPEFARHFTAVMMKQGFRVAYDSDPLGRLYTYVRS
jgi:hypothetical protein